MVQQLLERMPSLIERDPAAAFQVTAIALSIANELDPRDYWTDRVMTLRGQAQRDHAYVLSFLGCAIGVFDRDPATGALRQKPGQAGAATTHAGHGACSNRRVGAGTGFAGGGIALSARGARLFVSARAGLAMYSRRASGALHYDGCVSDDGEGTCDDVKVLNVPISPVTSPDGRNVYVGVQGGDAVSAFDVPRRKAAT
jgi:hypothetical protein